MCRIHDNDDPAGEVKLADADFPFLIFPPLSLPGLSLQQCGRIKRNGAMVSPIVLDHATGKVTK